MKTRILMPSGAAANTQKWFLAILASLLFLNAPAVAQTTVALVGATVVDVSDFGNLSNDLHHTVILIRDGRIVAVGPFDTVSIPKGTRTIDLSGKYVLPGLVDGFAGMNSQAQANAYLYMGVTTIGASGDDRRGHLFLTAHPSPHIYLLDGTGSSDEWDLLASDPAWAPILKGHDPDVELGWEDSSRMMDQQKKVGIRGLWLGHNLTTGNVKQILDKARANGLATYGEFISTPYSDAIAGHVSLLLHMTRYELGLAPPELLAAAVADPEGPAGRKAYASVGKIAPDDARVAAYGQSIADAHVALMPTFSLYYAELPGHHNLWRDPVAKILDPAGVFQPDSQDSGEPSGLPDNVRQALQRMVNHMWALNVELAKQHPRYLAASGGPVFSSLPGISMHTEMDLMVRLGLTERQALAAATGNYSEQLGWTDLGLVAEGRRADLLILNANPLEDIHNTQRIFGVVLDGKLIDRAKLLK